MIISQKQSHKNKQMPEKYGAYPRRNTYADVQIQWKPGGNNTEITGPHRCSPRNPPHISRASLIGKYLWVNTSDLYNILDMGKVGRGVLQVLQLKGTLMK